MKNALSEDNEISLFLLLLRLSHYWSSIICHHKKNEYFAPNFAKCVDERDTDVYVGVIENNLLEMKNVFSL